MSDKPRSHAAQNPGWFPKGRSGNLKGRPTSSHVPKSSAFEVLVEKTITVADRGATREITMEEALQQRSYRDALAGKRMVQREVLKWITKREAWLTKHAPKAPRPAITRHIPIPTTRIPLFRSSGSPRSIPRARTLAPTGHSSSLSPGRFRKPSAAGGAANA